MTLKEKRAKLAMEESEENDSEAVTASEEESATENESENDEDLQTGNAGWVDSISKILKTNKTKGKKVLVLSKAKKLADVKQKPKTKLTDFEIQTEDGEIKRESISDETQTEKTSEHPSKKRKETRSFRVKPDILQKDRERVLTKIATKGVVQLFNSVRMQQKDINTKLEEAGPLEVRKEKVMKNLDKKAFLNMLMGENSQNVDREVTEKKVGKVENCQTWSVLRDDFMMGAKLKDWDKELESNELEGESELE